MNSLLVRGKYVITKVTGRDEAEIITDGAVYQEDGGIVEVGDYRSLREKHPSAEVVGSGGPCGNSRAGKRSRPRGFFFHSDWGRARATGTLRHRPNRSAAAGPVPGAPARGHRHAGDGDDDSADNVHARPGRCADGRGVDGQGHSAPTRTPECGCHTRRICRTRIR